MDKETLAKVVSQTRELLDAPTCCQELKDVANEWLKALGGENEESMTEKYIAELKEDIMPIENLIAFAGSPAGEDYFGIETAKGIVAHGQEIQAQGAHYCDCPACALVESILKQLEE